MLEAADDLWAPEVLIQEVLNGVHRAERRNLLSRDAADEVVRKFFALGIETMSAVPFVERARRMAREYRQPSIFDAVYLVCAKELGAEMWTCDRKFAASFAGERPALLRVCPDDVP